MKRKQMKFIKRAHICQTRKSATAFHWDLLKLDIRFSSINHSITFNGWIKPLQRKPGRQERTIASTCKYLKIAICNMNFDPMPYIYLTVVHLIILQFRLMRLNLYVQCMCARKDCASNTFENSTNVLCARRRFITVNIFEENTPSHCHWL